MELTREKFRESESDFKGSTKTNFQIFGFQFEAFFQVR